MTKQSASLKLTVLLVSSLTIMSMITISPSLPKMAEAFAGVPNAEFLVKLAMTLPALFIAFFSPFAGMLIDKYGRLKLLYLSLVLYAVSGASGYFIDNLYYLLVGRAFLGLAVGISMTVVNTLVADYFEGPARQKFVGIQVAFMSLGGILFIGLGGVLADIHWRLPFLIYLFSLLVLPLAVLFLHEPEVSRALNMDEKKKLKSPSIIWMLFVNMMFMWIFFFLIPVQIPFHLKSLGVEKNALIGAAIALSTLFSAVSSFSYSRIKDRFGFYPIFAVGYMVMAISFGLIAMSESYLLVLIALILGGLGMGIMIPNTNIWVMKIAPPEVRGREIGRLTTFWFFGQFISPILLMPLVTAFSVSYAFYLVAGFLVFFSLFFLTLQVFTSQGKPQEVTTR